MGVNIEEEKLPKIIKKYFGDLYSYIEDDDEWQKKDGSTYYTNDAIFEETKLSVEGNDEYWETGTSIGMNIEEMKDDETKAQFAERVSELLNKIGIKTKPDFIYDGCMEG
jgi:hypothetical protein